MGFALDPLPARILSSRARALAAISAALFLARLREAWKSPFAYIQSLERANQCLDGILAARPDAIMAGSDEVAMWFTGALQDRGISVPKDCAIASMTYIQTCRGFRPAITTIDSQYEEVAMKAITMLLNDIKAGVDHSPAKQDLLFKPKLIVGQSCGANPAKDMAEN